MSTPSRLILPSYAVVSNSPVALSKKRYAETFALFCRLSHEYEAMDEAITRLLQPYQEESISLLEIGPGQGHFTKAFLAKSKCSLSAYTAYEPNKDYYQQLSNNLTGMAENTTLLSEPFTPATELQPEWDIILLSHSMYWLQPAEPHLRAAIQGVKPSGQMILFVQSPASLYLLQNPFHSLLETSHSVLNQHYSAHELMIDLHNIGVPAQEEILPGYLDLASIWDDDKQLIELGSFFMGCEIGLQPKELQQQFIHHIQSGTLQLEGRKLFNHPTSVVTVNP